jgi:hypothetical protein
MSGYDARLEEYKEANRSWLEPSFLGEGEPPDSLGPSYELSFLKSFPKEDWCLANKIS